MPGPTGRRKARKRKAWESQYLEDTLELVGSRPDSGTLRSPKAAVSARSGRMDHAPLLALLPCPVAISTGRKAATFPWLRHRSWRRGWRGHLRPWTPRKTGVRSSQQGCARRAGLFQAWCSRAAFTSPCRSDGACAFSFPAKAGRCIFTSVGSGLGVEAVGHFSRPWVCLSVAALRTFRLSGHLKVNFYTGMQVN